MKKLLLAMSVSCALPLVGAPVNNTALQNYVARTVQNCPGSRITLEPFSGPGPRGFSLYKMTQTSLDTGCGETKAVLYSSASSQVFVSDLFPIPMDPRPLEMRLADLSQELLKTPVKISIDSSPQPDGLWKVGVSKDTRYGKFYYHGFVDASRQYFFVGRRGQINVDPGKSLLDALGASAAASRGTRMAKVQILELSDFECPTCRRAHQNLEPLFRKNLSRISYSRLDLPLFEHHKWSFEAAMAARAIQKLSPASYWDYVDFVFENQELIKKENVETILRGFAEDHDLKWSGIQTFMKNPEERRKLLDQVSRAFDAGVSGTPTFVVNGQFVFYGTDGDYLRKVLDSLLK